MKLIEIVVLAGAHCISPVQQTEAVTHVGKVQCAVIVEKDTEAGTLRIVPAGATNRQEVAAVLQRLERDEPGSFTPGTTIQPAYAPAIAPPPAIAAQQPPAATPEEAALPEKPAAETPDATPATETRKPAPAKAEDSKKAEATKPAAKKAAESKAAGKDDGKKEAEAKHKCLGEAKPKWYTNEEGRRKYRCVLPG
jgi:hypothetical protein